MKYIIGLGNPGNNYKTTRHNIAWIIFDAFGLEGWKYDKYINASFVGDSINKDIILFVKPHTFMNRSGEIINALRKQNDFSYEDVIILHDDVDLGFGKVRISYNRGDGGHNGVKSIINHLGTKKIVRIRVGISRLLEEGNFAKPNVLSSFSNDEINIIEKETTDKVSNIIYSLIVNGIENTMNKYN